MEQGRGQIITLNDRIGDDFESDVYQLAESQNQARWIEADLDLRFTAGDQDYWAMYYGNNASVGGRMFYFNKMRRIREMITGYQRKNRKSLVTTPVLGADQQTADQITQGFYYIADNSNAGECVSEGFDVGSVTTGEGLIYSYVDFSDDPINGDIGNKFIPWCDYIIDPYWSRSDLSDCGYVEWRQWLPKADVIALYPDYADVIQSIPVYAKGDGRYPYQPQVYNVDAARLVYVDETWYKTTRERTILLDVRTGEWAEVKGDEEEVKYMVAMSPELVLQTQTISTVNTRVRVNGTTVYCGRNLFGLDCYPFTPVFGYRDASLANPSLRSSSVMRIVRDPQYLENRLANIMLDILESQPNSGWVYITGKLSNSEDLFRAGQGRTVAIDEKALEPGQGINEVLQQIQPTPINPSILQLFERLDALMTDVSGISEELLGTADEEIAGVLAKLRQASNLTTLQKLFDQLDMAMVNMGRIWLRLMKNYWTPGKFQRITGEPPTQQIMAQTYGKYQIRVEEGLNTATQRQMQFAQLIQLKQIDPSSVSTQDLLEAATIQNKDKIIQNAVQQQQQQQQLEQQQMQERIRLLEAQARALEAQAEADQGLGAERLSRIQENRADALEKLMEAVHRDEEAALDVAKAVKELDGMDLEQVVAKLKILDYIQSQNKQENMPSPGVETLATEQEFRSE